MYQGIFANAKSYMQICNKKLLKIIAITIQHLFAKACPAALWPNCSQNPKQSNFRVHASHSEPHCFSKKNVFKSPVLSPHRPVQLGFSYSHIHVSLFIERLLAGEQLCPGGLIALHITTEATWVGTPTAAFLRLGRVPCGPHRIKEHVRFAKSFFEAVSPCLFISHGKQSLDHFSPVPEL